MQHKGTFEFAGILFDIFSAIAMAGIALLPRRTLASIFGSEAFRRIGHRTLVFVRATAAVVALGTAIVASRELLEIARLWPR